MRNLRDYIDEAEKQNQLLHVEGANPHLEIGTLTEINSLKRGPALLFDKIKGYEPGYRIITSMMSNTKNLAFTLGLPANLTPMQIVSTLERKIEQWEKEAPEMNPKEVESGPVMENVQREDEVDLLKFPAPFWHELDGGPFIGTGGVIILKDPDTGYVNIGCYRLQVHGKNEVGLLIAPTHHGRLILEKYQARGEPCPVVVSLGHSPSLFIVGARSIPWGQSEYNWAGAIEGKPIEIIEGPVTGLPIPAESEIVIEGFVPPTDTRLEGPFGEYTGYYGTHREPQPYIQVRSVYYQSNPINLGAPPIKPPGGNMLWGCVFDAAFVQSELTKAGVPDAHVWVEPAGGKAFTVISIKQRYAGHARQAGAVAALCHASGTTTRYFVVVDEDVDPSNLPEVIWAMSMRSDPDKSIDIIRRTPSSPLDPIVRRPPQEGYVASRAIVDACRPWEWKSEFPAVVQASEELESKVSEKYKGLLEKAKNM